MMGKKSEKIFPLFIHSKLETSQGLAPPKQNIPVLVAIVRKIWYYITNMDLDCKYKGLDYFYRNIIETLREESFRLIIKHLE